LAGAGGSAPPCGWRTTHTVRGITGWCVLGLQAWYVVRDGLRSNDIDEQVIRTVFGGWHIQHMTRAAVPSDTRTLELLVIRLTT
jgi:hypothetical protein